ncbi:MAG: insulinase family protein [Chitinophagaceae bacterium]|jgi:predicted Zn-dependent peptidase|nr:insulinase family protein [Chitinophagaceae bacterium]
MLDRLQSPPIHNAVEFDLKLMPVAHYLLDNKTPVYAIDAGAEEVMQMEMVFYAGNWYEQQNMVASATNHILKNGTNNKTAFEINEHFDFYGAFLSVGCFNETAVIKLNCLSKYLPELLPVVAEILTESIFPEQELAIYKQNEKQRLAVSLKKSDFVAGRLIDVYLYGENHPYGKYTREEDLNSLQTETLKTFFRKFYTNGKCLIFLAGKLPSDIQQQMNKTFGKLPFGNEIAGIEYALKPATDKVYNIVNDANNVQGSIRIARPFPNRQHPDFPKVQVLNTILGGYFGSRLMSNIREEKGYTYGIHSYLQNRIHSSAWAITTDAGRDVCEATINEVWKEAGILREILVEKDELDLVRNYMIGSILGDLDGPFQIINRWKNYILNNLTGDYFYNSIEIIKTVSAQELRDLANKYLQPENFYQLTVV